VKMIGAIFKDGRASFVTQFAMVSLRRFMLPMTDLSA